MVITGKDEEALGTEIWQGGHVFGRVPRGEQVQSEARIDAVFSAMLSLAGVLEFPWHSGSRRQELLKLSFPLPCNITFLGAQNMIDKPVGRIAVVKDQKV